MNTRCSFSVLTPSLNQGAYLQDNLKTVAAQGGVELEHIVADGGSDDGTIELLKSSESSRLRWYSREDDGQADALNAAYSMASGDYIAWLNADDFLLTTRSLAAVAATFNQSGCDVVVGHTVLTDPARRVQRVFPATYPTDITLRAANFIMQPGVFLRRSFIETLDYFLDEKFHFVMDRDLWFRCLEAGAIWRRLSWFVAADRNHGDRKVLSESYFQERAAYDEQHRFPLARVMAFSGNTWRRLRGLWLYGDLIQAARETPLEIEVPTREEFLRLQLATPRRKLNRLLDR